MSMGEVTAMGEVHGEDFITGLEDRKIDGHVGLGAGVGLDVGVVGAEEFFGAVNGELFDFVDFFAAAIPAFGGVAFGVFVGEAGALRFHDRTAGEVFRGDEFDVEELTLMFGLEDGEDVGIGLREGRCGCSRWGGLSVECFHFVYSPLVSSSCKFSHEPGIDNFLGVAGR